MELKMHPFSDRNPSEAGATSFQTIRPALIAVLALVGLLLTLAPAANADILQIAGAGFERRCPCGADGAEDDAEEFRGVLMPKNVNMRYFAPVVFPVNGQSVCSFSLVYHDVNANDAMVATLKRKALNLGGTPFNLNTVMALVQSQPGTPDTMRRVTDNTILSPVINTASAFYFVQVDVPTVNLNIIGVQIDVRPSCS
jgi:hypothetical protein